MKNHLKSLRAAHGWSQADLATRLGVSRQTVNALEVGKYDPSLPLAFAIARLFGQPIEAIFEPNLSAVPLAVEQLQQRTQEEDVGAKDAAGTHRLAKVRVHQPAR